MPFDDLSQVTTTLTTLLQNASRAGRSRDPLHARTRREGRHALLPADIARHDPQGPDQAADLARRHKRDRLRDLGQHIPATFGWDDLVLPGPLIDSLRQLVAEARHRPTLWEDPDAQRLFPRGRGLTALLVGPRGTGKTMAAQVIAKELGLDLVRIDLSETVSKYIGETARNLRRIFTLAQDADVVLLFDEADALFAKRTEVRDSRDRHANTDTNYLLQLLEDYPGVALLASNRHGNIDSAFAHRLRHVFAFDAPKAPERRLLYERIVTELHGAPTSQRVEPALEILQHTAATGAQIKSAILSVTFLAIDATRPLCPANPVAALQHELSKAGPAIAPRDRARLAKPP